MSPAELPIAIFDSGVGGLTVYAELRRALPGERFVYLGDTARVPYGTKSADTIVKYSVQNAAFLAGRGAKLLVVACNTASAHAIGPLSRTLSLPVLGVIDSGVRRALALTGRRRVGVIGTQSTVASGCYQRRLAEAAGDHPVSVLARPCPLFVPLVEDGWLDHPVTREVARIYLEPFRQAGVDTLILGCTHYPMLKPVIADTLGPDVSLIDSAEAMAADIRALLATKGNGAGAGPPAEPDEFWVTDSVERFQEVAECFLATRLERVAQVDLLPSRPDPRRTP